MKVTISRNSWHYRLHRILWKSKPSNLCAYFWRYVWMLGLWVGAAVFALGVFAGLLMLGGVVVLDGILGYSEDQMSNVSVWLILLIGMGFWIVAIGAAVLAVLGAIAGWVHISEAWTLRQYRREEVPATPPGVIRQWLRAKKAHLCPLITLED